MKPNKKEELSVVNQYLNASCFNKINDSAYKNMLNYESEADAIEKKLINRIKEQVRHGKVLLYSRPKEKT